jgi:hypothetical protein
VTDELLAAYDQAVITAAKIFNGDITDTTGGAFAFRTPTESEWDAIYSAFLAGEEIPPESGFTNDTFPSLEPIQILILDSIAKLDDDRPAFIFARKRLDGDPAITDVP